MKTLIEAELAGVHDARIVSHIRAILIEPYAITRDWDYGTAGQQYLCWMVLNDSSTGAEIGYCEAGFGPKCTWGPVGSGEGETMGMDSGWFTSFVDAYFDSCACTTLPIWRVFSIEPDGVETPLTAEGDWDATWREVMRLRESDSARRCNCGHSISYRQPATH
jgi:hypothetical protein